MKATMVFDFAYLRPMPEIVIMAPSGGMELASMLKTANAAMSAAIRFPGVRQHLPNARRNLFHLEKENC